ncbi:MAG: precorrin-6y C5,15-methyltransferase (decarboxylating) subunit CbiE [Pseudomonadota bacterium]
MSGIAARVSRTTEPAETAPTPARPAPRALDVTVVGIGEDGWPGLSERAREIVLGAETVLGAPRQLAFLPAETRPRQRAWPSPMGPFLDRLAEALIPPDAADFEGARRLVLLASGSPMLHGIGASLAARGGAGRFAVIPHLSTLTLACARLGWPEAEVALVSACGHPVEALAAELTPDGRALVLSADGRTPAAVAALLRDGGYGASTLHVLERLGGPAEAGHSFRADETEDVPVFDRLNAVAVAMRPDPETVPLPRTGLPDDAFDHDGQITKRDVRLSALARLRPMPGALLWDIGAGAGSIGIEWCRAAPRATAIGVERDALRAERARKNAATLGAVGYRVFDLAMPEGLEALLTAEPTRPDAIFLGGGATVPDLLDKLLAILAPGGRLVAHGVTLETEAVLLEAFQRHGGELSRLQSAHADPVGRFTALRPAMAVTQWCYCAG